MQKWLSVVTLCIAVSLSTCDASNLERAMLPYAKAAGAYASGDLQAAAEAAKDSLGLRRNFLPAAVLLGKVNYFSGDDEAAIRILERAVRVSPRAGEATLWLSRTFRAAGKAAEAKKACELLLAADSQNIAALRLAACLALDVDEIAIAVAYLERAVESAGEAGLVFTDRAALRWAAGDAPGARSDLEAARAILPRGGAAWQAADALLSRMTGVP